MNSRDELWSIIEAFLEKAGEHADAVQVLATWNDNMGTHSINLGSGNWFSRQGMAHAFIKSDEAQTTAREIGNTIRGSEDE